ncbi:hypothetical protein BLA15816_04500 [Burkholderia lata]|uniref:Uncharacterized protein n=1 Tax=Burkholderia lata (strain ATCC 17760 / DSM 23089 / LMG 22485 / NCIMB 9086 / R18194 / 383) TaxID=482957 RepID=A0A6P2NBK7_BURL3|nr:hypothetical protein BLA15816_04500 [Burkholderia lata]VWC22822.1 hypothetical protein BLA15945_06003 [Burkholderia lata]VWC39974.1 hypothetical protein BLA14095_06842 [Burkholderia lata]
MVNPPLVGDDEKQIMHGGANRYTRKKEVQL